MCFSHFCSIEAADPYHTFVPIYGIFLNLKTISEYVSENIGVLASAVVPGLVSGRPRLRSWGSGALISP